MNKEIGLYIHIPFCKSKCSYCDFNSFSNMEDWFGLYFNALKKEFEYYKMQYGKHKITVTSVFIGGGTPSIVEAKYIEQIFRDINEVFKLNENAEISIEVNPGTIDSKKLKEYKAFGINRLSVGLQAWQDELLKFMGRIHTLQDFLNTYDYAKTVGFNNINLDLIFGYPTQTFEQWRQTIDNVLMLDIQHLSCYSLKVEEGTKLHSMIKLKTVNEPDDILDREMYDYCRKALVEKGFCQYEISNFSQKGFNCKHNVIYWKCKDYIGLGAGAHSYFNNRRYSNTCDVREYCDRININSNAITDIYEIDEKERISERIVLGLRMNEGVSLSEFEHEFKISIFDIYKDNINKLLEQELIITDKNSIRLSKKGLDFGNIVFMEFI